MLHGVFLAISAAVSVLLCARTGAFQTWNWLWQLPVGFVGNFLVLMLGLLMLVLIMAAGVDMKKVQQEDSPFYRAVAHGVFAVAMPFLRIRVHQQGFEKKPKDSRCLVVCNHLYDFDPVFLLRAFPEKKLAFISKQENETMPIVGPFLHKMLGQPINRENDREALKTILNCIRILKEDLASIAVFPEGYCSKDHKLRPLRSGVFKIAQKTGVPIAVCTIRNTHEIMPNAKKLRPTDIHLHLVGVISGEEARNTNTVDLAHRVYTMMAQDLGETLVWQENPETT